MVGQRTTMPTPNRVHAFLLAAACSLLSPTAVVAQVRLQQYATGFNMPVGFVQDPVDPSVHYVVEQTGRLRTVRNGIVLTPIFLDLSASISCCGERGLLGLAFAPDYPISGRFYVNFTNPDGHTVVARFKRSGANPFIADS